MLKNFKNAILRNKTFQNTVTYLKYNLFSTKRVYNKKLKLKKDSPPEELDNNPNILDNNLYIQILSCLNKINQENDIEIKEKLQNILSNYKVNINDENIMNLIKNNSKDPSEIKDILSKLIEEEVSEEEYASNSKVRFIRPPHTSKEMKNLLEEAEKIYEENKKILLFKDEDSKKEIKEKFLSNIPKYFTIRNLNYPETNSEILLIGVQRNSNLHSLFLNNILNNYSPELIALNLSPDHPMFINAESDYKKDWKTFVKTNEMFTFVVNPLPKSLLDIIITQKKLELIYKKTFANCDDIRVSPKIIFSSQSN